MREGGSAEVDSDRRLTGFRDTGLDVAMIFCPQALCARGKGRRGSASG